AVTDVVDRHETLRTVYPAGEHGPVQQVLPVTAVQVDLRPQQVPDVPAAVGAAATTGFDVTVDPPVRTVLLRLADDDHILVVIVHHIAADGGSLAPLAGDLMHAYAARVRGAAPTRPPLPVQYADYTLWFETLLGDPTDP